MPANATEVEILSRCIEDEELGEWGSCYYWPAERIKDGDWSAIQWFDGSLSDAVTTLTDNEFLQPLETNKEILATQIVRGVFEKCDEHSFYTQRTAANQFQGMLEECDTSSVGEGQTRGFYTKSAKLRNQIRGQPEQAIQPKRNKRKQAYSCLNKSSQFLVAMGLGTHSSRLTAVYSQVPSIGSGWAPVKVADSDEAKALAVWWNSTPSWLQLLNQRSRSLTWVQWSIAQLRAMQIPDFSKCDQNILLKTFDKVADKKLQPMGQQEQDVVRHEIDRAAAQICGLDEDLIADWRRRLAQEPTISKE